MPDNYSQRPPRRRSRSRSPHHHHQNSDPSSCRHRHRSRSPRRESKATKDRKSHQRQRSRTRSPPLALPFNAQHLSKHDLSRLRPLFEYYLDVQKGITLAELSEEQTKGRWKGFVGRWNRAELAEGWYDPKLLNDILSRSSHPPKALDQANPNSGSDTDSSSIGPSPAPDSNLPLPTSHSSTHPHLSSHGPTVPTATDLHDQRHRALVSRNETYVSARQDLQQARRSDRSLQKERLEELVPKADPGSFERKLEKHAERAAGGRGGGADDGGDGGPPGGGEWDDGDGGIESLKKEREKKETKRSEWERRREEDQRVKRGEWEARMEGVREREEKVLDGFREIVRARFGGGD